MKKQTKAFYTFMHERENIRLKRERGEPPPWTDDEILQDYRFTNVKREHDRTTRELVNRFYPRLVTAKQLLLNATIARYFGTVEMASAIGWRPQWTTFDREQVESLAQARMANGEVVFTKAYIIPNCGDAKRKYEVVCDVIDQVWENAAAILEHSESWQIRCETMQRLVRGCGAFMAKEVMLDYILVSGWRPTDWYHWTPMGPGAIRGASRVANDGHISKTSTKQALAICKELYAARDSHWDGVELDLTDIQFQLCEYDKYMRAKNGEGLPKNRFSPYRG